VAGRRLRAFALVDSGSDVSFLPRFLAKDLRCLPDTYDLPYEAGGRTLMAGDVMARVDLHLSEGVVRIPLAAFLIPGPEHDFPFLVLGQEPLFHMAEVRFRAWEGRLGLMERKHRWLEGRYGGPVGPLTSSREFNGAR